MNLGKLWMAVVILLAGSVAGVAQTSPDLEQGMKPYGSYHGGAIDSVSLTNQNLTLRVPLFAYSQRGGELAFPVSLLYNNKVFSIFHPLTCAPGTPPNLCPKESRIVFGPAPLGTGAVSNGNSVQIWVEGYPGQAAAVNADTSLSFNGNKIYVNPQYTVSPDGSVHQMARTDSGFAVLDGSGFAGGAGLLDSNGTNSAPSTATDRNGNSLSSTVDTLGRQFTSAPGPATPATTPPASSAPLTACPALNYAFQPVTFAYTWNLPTINGGTMPLILCYAGVWVRTGTSNGPILYAVNKSFTMLQSVVFPDATYWAFQYDAADPNNSASNAYGDLLKVTFPTGGSITYTWSFWANGCGSGIDRAVMSRTVDANDGTGPHTWLYNNSVVTDPLGNDTVHVISALGETCTYYETQTQYYQGSHTSGTLLKTVITDYQYTVNPYDPAVIGSAGSLANATSVINVLPNRVTTTLANGLTTKTETVFDSALVYHGPLDGITSNIKECPATDPGGNDNNDCHFFFYGDQSTNPVTTYTGSYGKAIAVLEYDWGHGAPGPLLRQTQTTYQWQVNSAYLTANLLNLPATVKVLDGAGHLCAETDYAYDETTPVAPSPAINTQHVVPSTSIRGNLTTTTRKLSATPCAASASWASVTSHSTWFDTGELQSSTDPLGHTTTHLYDSAYAGAFSTQTCSPSTGGVTHCVTGTYDFNTGLLTSLTNENASAPASGNTPGDSAHTSHFSYDSLWRILSALAPPDPANNNQQDTTSFAYSLSPLMVTRQKSVTNGLNDSASAYFDGVGRSFKSTHTLPNGTSTVLTTFDNNSRVSTVTNPFFTTSDPTYGVTQSIYDGLGRVTQVIKQDGSISQVKYNVSNTMGLNADCTTTTDEAGKQRGACTDALGRLVEVDEPYASGLVVNNYATLQSGGNFVLESSANSALWSTGTGGTNAQSIFMQDDGNLVLYIFKWSAGVYAAPTPGSYPQATCSIGTYLVAGQTLPSGSCIASPHWQYFLYMAPDGNLYIYNWAAGVGTWGPGTQGHPGAYARLETDGNFVVYTSTGVALWSSGTSGTNAERLDMEDDGRIIIYKSAWNSGTSTGQFNYTTLAHPGCDAGIGTGTTGMLGTGQCFVSPNGHFELLLQSDGNLVIYDLGVTPATARWSTNTSISPVDPGYSMRTLYSYDTLGNLLRVEQHGGTTDSTQWRVRTFTYNSFSQLLTATNPESGTISYTYDAEGKLLMKTSPAPNILPPSTATQTVSYCYDELHRVTKRDYQPHTYNPPACPITAPVVSYVYDSGTNANGQLVSMTDQAGTATYAYDVLGRMTTETRPIAGVTKSIGYGYNLNGSIKTLTYPSGRVVTYTPDTAGQLITAADGNGTQYVTNATYYASGAEYQRYMPGIYFRTDLNPRLQVSGFYSDNSQTNSFFMNKTYSFGAVHQNNGNVMSITNNKDSNRTQTFTYDGLNRITAGWSSANSGAMSWGENYAIDAWGNLQMTPMAGKAHGGNFTLSATVKNQPTGLGYDVAGNLLTYGTASYLYDLENRMLSTAGMSYTYDGNGERVLKSQTVGGAAVKRYWSMGGNALAEADGSGNLTAEYIYFGGQRVARIDLPAGSVHYYLSDHLKSTSMVVSAAGAIEEDSDYSSFGTEYPIIGAGLNRYKFTGKERDSETGLDYFGARYYSNGLGRFTSADSTGYSALIDPQRWNLYAYVMNNPLRYKDPDGHAAECKTDANKCLAAAQAAVGNKDAASRLYINKVTETKQHNFLGIKWTTTTTRNFLGIQGDVKSFAALSGNASRMASMISDSRVFGVSIQSSYTSSYRGFWNNVLSGGGETPLHGGAMTNTESQSKDPEVFVDPKDPEPGVDSDAARDHIPPANLGEKFAHEYLGHLWGEEIAGHPAGSAENKQDSINSENAVRATDPTRGQKTAHHD